MSLKGALALFWRPYRGIFLKKAKGKAERSVKNRSPSTRDKHATFLNMPGSQYAKRKLDLGLGGGGHITLREEGPRKVRVGGGWGWEKTRMGAWQVRRIVAWTGRKKRAKRKNKDSHS